MEQFTPRDPDYRKKITESFAHQRVMETIGASLMEVEPGRVTIRMEYDARITQQDGFVHAGIISTVVDSACGYAALSLMDSDRRVLSIEFKVNLLAPAVGDYFLATGSVRKSGKTIVVTEGELVSVKDGEKKLSATMVATMMSVAG
mgnify:CR=1 FL=1